MISIEYGIPRQSAPLLTRGLGLVYWLVREQDRKDKIDKKRDATWANRQHGERARRAAVMQAADRQIVR